MKVQLDEKFVELEIVIWGSLDVVLCRKRSERNRVVFVGWMCRWCKSSPNSHSEATVTPPLLGVAACG